LIVRHIVYVFEDRCWRCGENISLAYVERVPDDEREIGDEGLEVIEGKPYANVQKVYSKTLERDVWGNICPECGAYQGNFFLFTKWASAKYEGTAKVMDVIEQFTKGKKCPLCGKEVEELVIHHINYEPPETIEICRSCHIKIHRREGFLDYKRAENG